MEIPAHQPTALHLNLSHLLNLNEEADLSFFHLLSHRTSQVQTILKKSHRLD